MSTSQSTGLAGASARNFEQEVWQAVRCVVAASEVGEKRVRDVTGMCVEGRRYLEDQQGVERDERAQRWSRQLKHLREKQADRMAEINRTWSGQLRDLAAKRNERLQEMDRSICDLPKRMAPMVPWLFFFAQRNEAHYAELARLKSVRVQIERDSARAEQAAREEENSEGVRRERDFAVIEQNARDSQAAEMLDLEERQRQERQQVEFKDAQALQVAKDEHQRDVRLQLDALEKLCASAERCPSLGTLSAVLVPTSGLHEQFCTVGQVAAEVGATHFKFPFVLPVPLEKPVLVVGHEAKEGCVAWSHELLLRLLTTFPPGRLRFTLIDPLELGGPFAPFLGLNDFESKLLGEKVWTKPRDIEGQLARLEQHAELVVQKYLRDDYATIGDYNREVGDTAEPYQCLIIHGFPEGFSDAALKQLQVLFANGPRCGVFPCVFVTEGDPKGRWKALSGKATYISFSPGGVVHLPGVWPDALSASCVWFRDGLPNGEVLGSILAKIGGAAADSARVEVDYFGLLEMAGLTPDGAWRASSAEDLVVPLGPSGPGKFQALTLGRGVAHHTLIAGKTGSGKSTLLHNIITTAAVRYSPEELQFHLVDFKRGVEFQVYAAEKLPHAQVIGIESEREFGLAVLEALREELDRRGVLFRGVGVDGLSDYRRRTGLGMPRLLLIIDEFQLLFEPEDTLARQASAVLDHLLSQGRSFGLHVVLATQTLAGRWTLARGPISSHTAVRIALMCSEADSRLILAEDNLAGRLLTRVGEAIYNDRNGLPEGNGRFQVAWLPEDKQRKALRLVAGLAEKRGWKPAHDPIVFAGNELPRVEGCKSIVALRHSAARGLGNDCPVLIPGTAVALRGDASVVFIPQGGANLLVFAPEPELRSSLFVTGLTGLAAQRFQGAEARVTMVDAMQGQASLRSRIEGAFPGLARRIQFANVARLSDVLVRFSDLKNERRNDVVAKGHVPAFLVLHGLQHMGMLRNDPGGPVSPKSGSEGPPARLFEELLREGPEVGLYVIAVCDRFSNYSYSVDPNRRLLSVFDLRVGFQMSADDSNLLFGSPDAGRLGPKAGLFFNRPQGQLVKFRPFQMPEPSWVEQMLAGAQRE